MSAYDLLYPALMTVFPLLFLGLWHWWTRAADLRALGVATLAALLLFGLIAWLLPGLAGHPLFTSFWSMGALMALLWIFAIPAIRRAFAALPAEVRTASLKPRRVELPLAILAAPWAVWLGLVLWMLGHGGHGARAWIGAGAGLLTLALTSICLPAMVREPEPLGGPDPEALARRYEQFRRRRILTMHVLMSALALFVTASGTRLSGGEAAGLGGALLGVAGALFGSWADAQRYLLRRQQAGLPPP